MQWNPDFSNLLGKRKLIRKIGSSKNRRWHEITLYLQGIVFDNQESKQKYYGTLVQFFSFHLSSHTLGFYSTQKLEPPCAHDKPHQQESQA